MATAPRDLSDAGSGLAPLKPPGPATNVGPLRVDVLSLLSDRAKAIVIGQGQDYIGKAQAGGDSDYTLMRMRGLLRRIIRAMHEYEVGEADAARPVDIDTTRW